MTFDWGVIISALAPTLMIVVTAVIGWFTYRRTRREDREERAEQAKLAADTAAQLLKQGNDTHVLVNDQLTREKATRLLEARTNMAVLEKMFGKKPTIDEQALLVSLQAQIVGLADEIEQRDLAAGTLKSKGSKNGV